MTVGLLLVLVISAATLLIGFVGILLIRKHQKNHLIKISNTHLGINFTGVFLKIRKDKNCNCCPNIPLQ
jgi:Co/Zn/Cd efflux system component